MSELVVTFSDLDLTVGMLARSLLAELPALLERWGKMVFLSGPRPVGKTTLARELLSRHGGGLYFNWDLITDRQRLARDPYFFEKAPRPVDIQASLGAVREDPSEVRRG